MTIVLGESAHRAAKSLAVRWGVTQAEAIRRAVIEADRDACARQAMKRAGSETLNRARDVFALMDLDAEIERIQRERDRW
jgi:hypothetical protein